MILNSGCLIANLKKKRKKSGKTPLFILDIDLNNKVEVKYETQLQTFLRNFKNIIISIFRPLIIIISIVLILYGLFYVVLFSIVLFGLIYFYKRIKNLF